MIELINVCAGYGREEVLHNISVGFKTGEITALTGMNGCGKSTLLKTIIKLAGKTAGKVLVSGKPYEEYSPAELAKKIAYLPQSRAVPDMTVAQLVMHGRFPHLSYPRVYREKDFEIAREAMCTMGIEELAEKNISGLSGGTRQKAYIAMALAQRSPVILMDEPLAYLDIPHQLKLCDIMRELSGKGKAVVIVIHDISLALKTADKIAVMQYGKIIDFDTPSEIVSRETFRKAFNIDVKPFETENGTEYFYKCLL